MTSTVDRAAYRRGIVLTLMSALAFALLPIFGKQAYAAGLDPQTLLLCRFGLAAVVFWVIAGAVRARVGSTRLVLIGLALGAFGYAVQAWLFFVALGRLTAGLTSLLLYTFPAIVFVATLLTGRERIRPRGALALVCAVGGVALVLLGGGAGQLDLVGVLAGLGSAIVYSGYLMATAVVPDRMDRIVLAALISTGAAGAHLVSGLALGTLDFGFAAAGWIWLVAIAVVSTSVAMILLLVGIRLVGAPTASVVSCVEPVGTVLLAVVLYADPFGLPQIVGTAAVVAAVVLLQRRAAAAEPDARAGP